MTIQEAPVCGGTGCAGPRSCRRHGPCRRGGLEALTMRTLAEVLGVAPMALYRHVANKDDLIDAMVDVVFSEIGVPSGGGDWKTAMRERAIAVREALMRHRWAIGLMESRATPVRRTCGITTRSSAGFGRRLRHRDGRPRLLGPGQLHLRLRR